MQLSLRKVIMQFLGSRGGLIVAALGWSIGARLVLDYFSWIDVASFFAVVLCWPAIEWLAHKYLMHAWRHAPFYVSHRWHHWHPNAETGLPETKIIIGYYLLSAVLCALDRPILLSVWVAVLSMLVAYEFVHYSVHLNYRPKTRWGWCIRINHLQHHYHDSNARMSMLFPPRK
jgi:hypothetical protein